MLGVNGATITVQQAGAAEEPGAIPKPGEGDTALCRRSEQVDEVIAGLQLRAVAATHHQQVQLLNCRGIETRVRPNHQAQVTDHLAVM